MSRNAVLGLIIFSSVHSLGHLFIFLSIRIQDVSEAEPNFNVARSHSQNFAFVHIAHAQFEISQGRHVMFVLQNMCQFSRNAM